MRRIAEHATFDFPQIHAAIATQNGATADMGLKGTLPVSIDISSRAELTKLTTSNRGPLLLSGRGGVVGGGVRTRQEINGKYFRRSLIQVGSNIVRSL